MFFWNKAGVMFVWIAFQACFRYQMAHILFLEWHSSFLFMSVHILGCLSVWFAFQVCALFRSWLGLELTVQHCLPHGVEDSSVLHDAEQLVGGGHVVRDRPLAIPEKGVRRPDLADHQVVEPQDLNGALEFQPFVNPCLTKEHVHGVFLGGG